METGIEPAGKAEGFRKAHEFIHARVVVGLWRIARLLIPELAGADRSVALNRPEDPSILVLKLDEIGDVVLSSPFLRELRECAPEARITLVVKPGVLNLVERCPYVDEIKTFDWTSRRPGRAVRIDLRAARFGRRLARDTSPQIAFIPRWDADFYHASVIAAFSGAPRRVVYTEAATARKRMLNRGFDDLATLVLQGSGTAHEVERNLEMLGAVACTPKRTDLELWHDTSDETYADEFFTQHDFNGRTVICLSPAGGNAPEIKQWPTQHFVDLAERLKGAGDCRFVLVGGRGEEEIGQMMSRSLGSTVADAIGQTTLRQMGALMRRCHLFIGNDSGPMHVAAASGIPVVGIFAGEAHRRFRPWCENHRIVTPRGDSTGTAIDKITVSDVFRAAMELRRSHSPRGDRV